jgi:RASD family protein 2
MKETTAYWVLVMGGRMVGMTFIISQFMKDKITQNYKSTLQEMNRIVFTLKNSNVSLNIEDTGGSFATDFPVMFAIPLTAADTVILVYAVVAWDTFEELAVHVIKLRPDMPTVVVSNKTDLEREGKDKRVAELVVECDWENGYVECRAKLNINIQEIFMEILKQATIEVEQLLERDKADCSIYNVSKLIVKRRQSLPANSSIAQQLENIKTTRKKMGKRRRSTISSTIE